MHETQTDQEIVDWASWDSRTASRLTGVFGGLILAAVLAGLVVAVFSSGSGEGSGGDDVNYQFGGILPEGVAVDDREGIEPPTSLASADLDSAAKAASCEVRTDLKDQGATHLASGEKPPEYATTPPTSGDHSPEPLADGAFTPKPPPVNSLHTLEHGRVAIQYNPNLGEEIRRELKHSDDAAEWADTAVSGSWGDKAAAPTGLGRVRDTFR